MKTTQTHQLKAMFARWQTSFTAAGVALAIASTVSVSAETVFRYEFNEGVGFGTTNTTGTLPGFLGRESSPNNNPLPNESAPSGTTGDLSLRIQDPDGYLLVDATGATDLLATNTPITAEAWIFIPTDAVARPEGIIGSAGQWKLGLRPDGQLAFTLFAVADINSGLFPALGVWTHVAAVWEPGVGVTYYIDGVNLSFIPETGGMRSAVNNWLGIGSGGVGEPINASIDRVRIHRAVLTAEQLDSVAATPKGNLPSTLVAFNFNETVPPYSSTGSIARQAVFAQPISLGAIAPKWSTNAPSGLVGDTSLTFDGNDVIRVNDPNSLFNLPTGDFTLQTWVKFGTLPQARSVLFGYNGPGGALSMSVTQDRRVFVTTFGVADTSSAAFIPNDTLWHHIAIVHRNGTDLRFYVDGVLGDTLPYTGGVIKTRTDTYYIIGAEPGGWNPFVGSLDRMQVSDTALNANELDYLAIPGVNPEAPEIEIGTAVSIAWPTVATGFILQSTTSLNEPRVWTNVDASTATVVGDKRYIMLPTPATQTFYRLIRPVSE